jgi:hypothetical protein
MSAVSSAISTSESTPRTARSGSPTQTYIATANWSETSQIPSDFDKNWSGLKDWSRGFCILHYRRNLRNAA